MRTFSYFLGKNVRMFLKCAHPGEEHKESCLEMHEAVLESICEHGAIVRWEENIIAFIPWHQIITIDNLITEEKT